MTADKQPAIASRNQETMSLAKTDFQPKDIFCHPFTFLIRTSLCCVNTTLLSETCLCNLCLREEARGFCECIDLNSVSAEFHKLSHTVSPAYTPTYSMENTIIAPH